MKKLLVFVVLIVVGVVAAKRGYETYEEKQWKKASMNRVASMLKSLKTGDPMATQDAFGYWFKGSVVVSEGELRGNLHKFDSFRREQAITRITTFEVASAEVVRDGNKLMSRVRLRVDGQDLLMLVKPGQPIEWDS